MYFKKLELLGFKSFAEKAELQFEPGVTAIVGPNGCGKTNISDAIKWVLGEQSAKQLRGAKMEDIIFNGSRTCQPLGMSEVSLTLDNSQNVLPVDYNEITVTRRLFRTGESEYLLNKAPCRHKDIVELFMDTGVGTDIYSSLENKQIEMILNSKPEDRRFLFEEAAGVMKYKTRRNEALHKLEQTAQNLLRLGDVLNEVKSRIGSLDYQSRKARQYQKYQQELRDLELKTLYCNWKQLYGQKTGLDTLDTEFSQEAEKINTEVSVYTSKIEEIKLVLTQLDERILESQQKAYSRDSQIARLEDKVFGNKERKIELESQYSRTVSEGHDISEKLAKVTAELQATGEEKIRIEDVLVKIEETLADKNRHFEDLSRNLQQRTASLEEDKSKYIDLLNKKSQTKNTLITLTTEQKNAQVLHEKLQLELTSLKEQLTHLHTQHDELNTQCQMETERYNQLLQEKDRLEEVKNKEERGLQNLRNSLQEAKNAFHLKNSMLVSLQELKSTYVGYDEEVKKLLQEKPEGVIGTLPQIIQVQQEEYAPLVEKVLDEKLQYVICENDAIVQRVRTTIGNNEQTRLTLVSLEGVKQLQESPTLPAVTEERIIGRLSDFVSSASSFQSLIEYFFGNVYIVVDISIARQLSLQKQTTAFITLQGEYVPDRALLALKGKNTNSGLLEREIKIKHLEEECTQGQSVVERLSQETEAQNTVLLRLQEQVAIIHQDIQNKLLYLQGLQKDYELVNGRRKELHTKCNVVDQEEETIRDGLAERQKLLETIASEYQHTESAEQEAKSSFSLREEEINGSRQQQSELKEHLTMLKVELVSTQQKSSHLENLAERLRHSHEELLQESHKIKDEGIAIAEQIQELEKLQTETEENINTLLEEKKFADAALDGLREAKQEQINSLRQQEGHIHRCQERIRLIEMQKHEYEIKQTQITTQLAQVETVFKEEYHLEKIAESIPPELIVPGAEEIDKLKKKIESLGPVNLVAIDEHEQLQERYTFLLKQHEDLLKAREDIHKVIQKINHTTKEYFEKTFAQVQQNFGLLFKQLFEGGEAEMVLTNPDDLLETGIDINVQPPGKKLTNITLLSGGEKALTAIAILFAIFMVKPSPFCVLDEIDAPLDDSNLNRFVRLLKEFSQKTQFIIITHNKKTMEMADVLYGVTMEEFGVSKLVSVKFRRVAPVA